MNALTTLFFLSNNFPNKKQKTFSLKNKISFKLIRNRVLINILDDEILDKLKAFAATHYNKCHLHDSLNYNRIQINRIRFCYDEIYFNIEDYYLRRLMSANILEQSEGLIIELDEILVNNNIELINKINTYYEEYILINI
jgi:hypothetical protein